MNIQEQIKQQEEEFDEDFKYLGEDEYDLNRREIKNWHRNSIKSILEGLVERAKKQVKIHQHIIDTHDIAPFKWHEGRIAEAQDTISYLQSLIKEL